MVKVSFFIGDEQDLGNPARKSEEQDLGNPARKSEEQDLEAGFKPSNIQINNVKLDLEAQTTHMDDNETICDSNVNTFTKLFRVLCDLF